jgi:branched-chain amino acid transport system permease protein
MAVAAASEFFGFKLSTATSVYYCALFLLVVLTFWMDRLRQSPFGMTLRAGRQNARRVSSVGLALRSYQLTAYVLSAVLCGVAGMLLANLSAYASPSSMSWVVSGDLIVMVVLGGMGTVLGPITGAFLFMGVEEILKTLTDNWMAIFGLLIVAIAMLGKAGVVGWLEGLIQKSHPAIDHESAAQQGEST